MGNRIKSVVVVLLAICVFGCDDGSQTPQDAGVVDSPQVQDRKSQDLTPGPRPETPVETPDTGAVEKTPEKTPDIRPLPPLPAPTTDLSDGIYDVCFVGGRLPGRKVSTKECECVAKMDATAFKPGTDQAKAKAPSPDPRTKNPKYAQWTELIEKTHCACCHNSAYKGPGSYVWDLGFKPLWWDSASDRSLRIMADPQASPGRSLPIPADQLKVFKAFVDAELARREKLRNP